MLISNIKPITDAEAKEILAKKMKNRELNYEQQMAYEYLKNTVKLSKSDSERLKKELEELGLKESKIINIVNLVPKDEEILKLMLKKEKELKPAQIKKILEIVKKY